MEYQVTARKWRPQFFGEVIGQEHVTRALTNAIESGKIPHAFLFSGPRGVGKTTTARILAKSLNCESGISAQPCQKCASCQAITAGQSLDVREIDGASNRGIDNIREIRDNISYVALNSRFKIIIIDEVHMLTTEASNALLKTLEEPPEHVFFVLATTEPNKVLPTIRSRCQHYLFKRISVSTIIKQLQLICNKEGIAADEQGLYQIASAADGSMRDAETLFDQVVLYTDGKIGSDAVTDIIGIPEETIYFDVLDGIFKGSTIMLLRAVRSYIEKFGDAKLFLNGFLGFLRNGLLVLQIEQAGDLLELPESQIAIYKRHFSNFKVDEITLLIQLSTDLFKDFRGELNDRFVLELLIFRLMDYRNRVPLGVIRKELKAFSDQSFHRHQADLAKSVTVSNNKSGNKASEPVHKPKIPHSPKWDKDLETVLKEVLSKSLLTRHMISHFEDIEQSKSEIKVFLSVSASYEYLSKNLPSIKEKVQTETGYPVNIEFILRGQTSETDIPPADFGKLPNNTGTFNNKGVTKPKEQITEEGKEADFVISSLEKSLRELFD